ncbi:unnamed protein product [Musa acuminata var. zebrina]
MELSTLVLLVMACGLRVGADGTNHRYKEGDHVPLFANKVVPLHNPSETYRYYDLPFCSPDIETVYQCLQTEYGTGQEDLILYGQSVVSGPTLRLAIAETARRSTSQCYTVRSSCGLPCQILVLLCHL